MKDLASGSKVTALTPGQARDALAALERLQSFDQSSGRRVSLLAANRSGCSSRCCIEYRKSDPLLGDRKGAGRLGVEEGVRGQRQLCGQGGPIV